MPRPGRRRFDTGQDYFEKLQRVTGKTSPADVLEELMRGYRKWKAEDSRPSDAGTQSVQGDTVSSSPAQDFPKAMTPEKVEREEREKALPAERLVIVSQSQGSHLQPIVHPLDLEYKRLRNVLLTEKIETQKGLRVKATSQALQETVQCPRCGLMLLREKAWEHIRSHNTNDQLLPQEERRWYCFTHHAYEPVSSVCRPASREEVLTDLHGGVYPSGLTETG
jgi:hypothetical protein